MELVNNKTWDFILKPILYPKLNIIIEFLDKESIRLSSPIYPSKDKIFRAFNNLNFEDLKVIILGQDPYYNGNADGLAFSSQNIIPPSLMNIFKAIRNDIKIENSDQYFKNGNLEKWVNEGILLLNSSLTVVQGTSLSHLKIWESLTDNIIKEISEQTENKVFILWGNYAKSKQKLIDSKKHLILTHCHPSPMTGNRFLSCTNFSECNKFLESKNIKKINWYI